MANIHVQNPHDKLFKETFRHKDVTKDFVTYYLPAHIVEQIDVNTLEPQKDSFITQDLKEVFSDLLFKVNIHDEEGYLYLLFEHKSYQSPNIAVQLLKYMVKIWDRQPHRKDADTLPLILPLVIYHGKQTWHVGQSLGDVVKGYDTLTDDMKRYVPNYHYLLFDVSTYQDEQIKGVAQLKILFTVWRNLYTKNPADLKESIYQAAKALNTLDEKASGIAYFETVMRYIFNVSDAFTKNDIRDIVKTLEQAYPMGSDVMKTIADVLREEGIEQGIEQGIEKGEQKGMAKTLLAFLSRKIEHLPEETEDKLRQLDDQKLETIVNDFHQIETVEDLNKYL